jgi:luciferase family oxidoreductase group 1
MVPFSILDLAPIVQGGDAALALRNTLELGRHGERLGYRRIWFAEHHGMAGVASAATSIVIAHVAAGTSRIRVGAGGIMLPNHAPLVIAEQFGTLACLFPGRIDLGVGRAPGTDPVTARALRRTMSGSVDSFPEDVVELMSYFRAPQPGATVQAVPGVGTEVPVWILGSSLFGAQLAAALGLPFAFASHFAPAQLMQAVEIYRRLFKPSPTLARPYVMLGVNIICAETDEEARLLATSLQQVFVQLRRGRPGPLPPPVDDFERQLSPQERAGLQETFACAFIGSPTTVRHGLKEFLARTHADELMVTSHIHDHQARLKSFALAAAVRANAEVS